MIHDEESPHGPEAMAAVRSIFAEVSDERHAHETLHRRIDVLKHAVSGIQIVAGDKLPDVVEILGRKGGEEVATHWAT